MDSVSGSSVGEECSANVPGPVDVSRFPGVECCVDVSRMVDVSRFLVVSRSVDMPRSPAVERTARWSAFVLPAHMEAMPISNVINVTSLQEITCLRMTCVELALKRCLPPCLLAICHQQDVSY